MLIMAQRGPGSPKPMARMGGGVGAQPLPQIIVGIGQGQRNRGPTVGGAGKPDRFARQPFGHAQNLFEHVHGTALGGRAQNFPFATSRRASFSSSASASRRLSLPFCSRNSLSSLAASTSMPP